MKRIITYAGGAATVAVATFFALNFSAPSDAEKMSRASTLSASIHISQEATTTPKVPTALEASGFHYIEIIDGCGPYYEVGTCVNMRSGPGVEFPVVGRLRTGVVFKVEGNKEKDLDGREWYKIVFDKEVRYPERVKGDWYVAVDAEAVRPFDDVGDGMIAVGKTASTTKHIVVNLTEEMLYAYDGDTLFMKDPISPGLELTPTPRGMFSVYYKTPSRYMQGPIPGISDQEYDLPGVPWNLYFTPDGAVIHGAYWHDHFGKRWSHGCVNLFSQNAKKLYLWADLGTPVVVRD